MKLDDKEFYLKAQYREALRFILRHLSPIASVPNIQAERGSYLAFMHRLSEYVTRLQLMRITRRGSTMNRVVTLCAIVAFCLLQAASAQTQISLAIPSALERAVEEKEPNWNLVSKMVRKNKEENYSYFRWRHVQEDIGVHVNEYHEMAQIRPNSLLTAAPRVCTSLRDIGDEAYLLSSNPGYGAANFDVVFRQGKVLITVEADSEEVAIRFAKHLASELPPRDKSSQPSTRQLPFNCN